MPNFPSIKRGQTHTVDDVTYKVVEVTEVQINRGDEKGEVTKELHIRALLVEKP